ncbi:Nucleosomal histone H3-Lys79 methylase [Rhodotorula kratochvilovae]
MFANRRPPPRPQGASSAPAKPPPATGNTLAVPRAVPSPSSPLSSLPSSSSPPTASPRSLHRAKPAPAAQTLKRTAVQVRTTTVVRTVQRVVPAPAAAAPHNKPLARTLNAYKRPADAPPLPGAPANKRATATKEGSRAGSESAGSRGKGKGRASTTASSDDDVPPRRRRKAAPPSSDLDPLTPSEEEDAESELSSVDEDYFAKKLEKEEGAPVCVRDVAAQGDGPTDGKSGESLVLENRAAYKEHFLDPQNPERPTRDWAGSDIPTIELEYPGVGVKERFALLAPKTNDEYNPIEDVLKVILTVLDHFLTKEEAFAHFGHQTGATSFSAFLYNRSSSTSRAGTPAAAPALALAAPPSSSFSALDAAPSPAPAPDAPPPPLIRELEKARAKRDGPAFLASIARYNVSLVALKADGTVARNIAAMRGLREKVWTKVFLQCYDRAVGPEIDRLKEYEAFSDNVYGELLPKFMNEIFDTTHLGPGSVFVDLGSGVGNCVVQAALAAGATAYGFENMAHASRLARLQVSEAQRRARMWGLSAGEMKVVEADFTTCAEVGEVMRRADVVLVNNEVFTAKLNQSLSWLFLDLPPSARIVSLKPFVPDKFVLSSHNANSPLAILNQQPARRYRPGSVSWKMEGGSYYVARVDRGRVERFQEREREREERRREKERRRKERREGSTATTPSVSEGAMSRSASRQG